MTCEESLELLSLLLDGELTAADIARVQQHLGQCEPCRAAQVAEAWLHALLAAGPVSEEPPDALRRRIRAAIAAEPSALRRRGGWRRLAWPAVLGAALGLLATILFATHHRDRGASQSPILADALAGHYQHADAAPAQLDVRGGPREVEEWIGARLGLAVRLPSGAARWETPVGARLGTVAGHPAAHVLYASEGRRTSLFVARIPPRRIPEEGEHIVDGVEVYTTVIGASSLGWWQDGSHLYLAVSSEGPEDLLELAALCVRSQRRQG